MATKTGLDEMAMTFDEFKKFTWAAMEDEFGLKYAACFENENEQEIYQATLKVGPSIARVLTKPSKR